MVRSGRRLYNPKYAKTRTYRNRPKSPGAVISNINTGDDSAISGSLAHTNIRKNSRFAKNVRAIVKSTAEKKYLLTLNNVAVSLTPIIQYLCSVPLGDGDSQRNGDQITAKSIWLRYCVITGDTTNLIRVILFQWSDTTAPTAQDILLSPSVDPVFSHWNHDTRYKYKIMYDKTHSTVTTTELAQQFVSVRKNNFKTRKLQYIGGSATVGYNMLYILVVSDSGAAPNPGFQYYCKLNYVNM